MHIALITKPGHADSGIGRYTAQLRAALVALGYEVVVVHPVAPIPPTLALAVRRLLGWDLTAFFDNYPVWVRYPRADVYHLAGQNLATLLLWRRPPAPVVVTVHDIIPWLLRNDPERRIYHHCFDAWFDRLALAGLRRAKHFIAVSAYTKEILVDQLHFEAKRIVVIHEGVG